MLALHGVQELLTQGVLPGQSLLSQQAPALHLPEQQTMPRPQSAALLQAAQVLDTQASPAQSAVRQQSPVTHFPLQHLAPAPHWPWLAQGAQ